MKKKTKHCDVIIIGGGLAGMSLACILGKSGVQVVCIDQADPKTKPQDLRTTAISYGSSKILETAGIWNKTLAKCPIENIEILDGNSPLLLNFLSKDIENCAFGWIVENSDLRAAMMKQIKSLKSVTHIAPAKVSDFQITDQSATAILEDNRQFCAPLIIGADGRQSLTRDFMGVETRTHDYKQRAIIACVGHENPHNNVAVEHFWPEGPFAVLPMADGQSGRKKQHRSSVVFTEHGPEKQSLLHFSDTEFEIALATKFPARYGDLKLIGRRAAYPLTLTHAADYIAPRMALIADAAHGIHPIAGQGLNLGFRDVAEIAQLIIHAKENGADIGSDALLQRYQRARRPDNISMVAVTDGLVKLFSNRIPGIGLLRKAGLKAVSKLPPAKQFFMKRAMGDR